MSGVSAGPFISQPWVEGLWRTDENRFCQYMQVATAVPVGVNDKI